MIIVNKCNRWEARFFALCDLVASWSEDQSRKVGSVIVGPANDVRSVGYNGLPRGVRADLDERHSREGGEKYLWFEHAERNAIYNLARTGVSGDGCRMYVNNFPCADCARAIIQTGIIELKTFAYETSDERFLNHYAAATRMLPEAGLKVSLFARDDPMITEVVASFRVVAGERF
jgi:dCMP deaminase